MKIGLKTKNYNDIICLDIPEDKKFLVLQILSCCKSTTEEEVDLIVTVNRTKTIESTENL